jgi:hypothetical protein
MKEQVIAYETVLAAPSARLVVTWPNSRLFVQVDRFRIASHPGTHQTHGGQVPENFDRPDGTSPSAFNGG